MAYILTETDLIILALQYFFYGFAGVAVVFLILLKVSGAMTILSAWVSKATLILSKKQNGMWELCKAKYKNGFYLADRHVFQAVSDGSDLGTLNGIPLGVTSELFGATINPTKIGAIELWKKHGLSGIFEAELFDYYVREGKMPDFDFELTPEVKVKDLYLAMQKQYGFTDPIAQSQKRFEELKAKIPQGDDGKSEVFWIEGKGLFARTSKLVDYNAIRNFQINYLRSDLIEAQIKAHVMAKVNELGNVTQIVKFVGIGMMVLLACVGIGILLKMLAMV